MKPTVDQVLAEANLSEAQIEQITTAVGDKLAAVRVAHIEEITAIEQSKDTVIGGLMRELVESKRSLAEATLAPSDAQDFVAESKDADNDVLSDEELEERVLPKVVAEVNKMLSEALRSVTPMVRRARRHDEMRNLVEGLQVAFGKVLGEASIPAFSVTALQESAEASARLETLKTTNKTLAEENLTLRQQMLFSERTAGMAQTTRERVQMVVEAAHPTTIQDFSDLLEVAIQSVKPAQEPAPSSQQKQAPATKNTLMQSVIDKL